MGRESLGSLGSSILALACAPKVSASIEVEVSAPAAPEEASEAEPVRVDKPEPATATATTSAGHKPGPPRVVRAEQLSSKRLRIHFSEAIAPIGDLDPNDFRVSVLSVYLSPTPADSYAYYYDWSYPSYGQALRFTGARAGSTQLDLEFEPEVPLYNCRMLDQAYNSHYAPPGVQSKTGLFLHYAAGSIPIRDEGGEALKNFGADWVIRGRSDPPQTRLDLTHAQLPQAGRTLTRVRCGPELPPGPR